MPRGRDGALDPAAFGVERFTVPEVLRPFTGFDRVAPRKT